MFQTRLNAKLRGLKGAWSEISMLMRVDINEKEVYFIDLFGNAYRVPIHEVIEGLWSAYLPENRDNED